jgi:hypothetical protein
MEQRGVRRGERKTGREGGEKGKGEIEKDGHKTGSSKSFSLARLGGGDDAPAQGGGKEAAG